MRIQPNNTYRKHKCKSKTKDKLIYNLPYITPSGYSVQFNKLTNVRRKYNKIKHSHQSMSGHQWPHTPRRPVNGSHAHLPASFGDRFGRAHGRTYVWLAIHGFCRKCKAGIVNTFLALRRTLDIRLRSLWCWWLSLFLLVEFL